MKNLIVEIEDSTKAELVEKVEVRHLSDLGCEVKEVIEDFMRMNEGALMPPLSIRVREKRPDEVCANAREKLAN